MNSPTDMEPTLTFTTNLDGGGGVKKTRRASFGRRVSFSTANKIKEFRTDERECTVWNATYEEERNSSTPKSSSDASSGEGT